MNLRQVRKKIKSVGNVKKITKAMQLVSAVKMKKSQAIALEGRPYREKLESMFLRVAAGVETSDHPLFNPGKNPSAKELVVLVSSDKGLCGAFNMNLFRTLDKSSDFRKIDMIAIGKKGVVFGAHMGSDVLADFSAKNPSIETTAIFDLITKYYLAGSYRKVWLVYNKFISTLRHESMMEQLLPISFEKVNKDEKAHDYLIEPDRKELFEQLLINFLEEKVRGALQNSEAAEHSARMIAMKNATDNATDVIYTLTLVGNNLRQQKITYELLDMITAKESVES